jgi:ribose transport system permease protein
LENPASPYAAVAAMLFLGLGIGIFNGWAVSRLRMPALIVTLAIWQMCRGGAYQMTRGWTILELPRSLTFFGQANITGVPVAVIIFIAVIAVSYLTLNHTSYGRSIYAVGGNPSSAWLSGLKVPNLILSVYGISGILAALAGLITLSRSMAGSMNTAMGLELDSIAAVVIGGVSLSGGRGNMIGVLLGVLTLGVINNGMNVYGLDPSLQNLVKGAIIFSAVAVDIFRRR